MDWYGCYSEGWQNEIVPEAFSHPAKFSRALIRRIYAHALECGYLREGDVVIDPFDGVALGALDAMFHGLHHIGIELEEKFVQLGQQNIDLWNRRYGNGKLRRWGTAVILQGDSRNLVEVLEGARAEGLIASPPFGEADKRSRYKAQGGHVSDCLTRSYTENMHSTDPSNLGNMPTGEPPKVDGLVSSPPFQQQVSVQDMEFYRKKCVQTGRNPDSAHAQGINSYGLDPANLGNQEGNTFWSAARAILLQCHQVLAPGGVAIFVTKRFVRDKQIVEFSQQWADLCQSCGFELVEWIKAWLVEERGTQYDLTGEAHTRTVKRFSFFRRLHAQKYPHLAIEWEDVLIFRKGKAA